jgi:dTDP-4-amino-4,6-dideoxygalactose transaminase
LKVPFADLHALHAPMRAELAQVLERVLDNNSFILGAEVQRFEKAFAQFAGVEHCVAVNNGTAALQAALLALEIGPGHEVITVANTFIATAEAISAVGARPVFVDVEPHYYNMDAAAVAAAITPRTRAIIPVHLYGQTADMDPLLDLAKARNLHVIEDACQAHGAQYEGRPAGSMGAMACFSFYPGKNLGALGEGGAVVCNDPNLAERLRLLRDHGSAKKYEHSFPGYNLRLEGIQGGFLAVKLPYLEEQNNRRRAAAQLYGELLKGSEVVTPAALPNARHVYHLYVAQAPDRDALRQQLGERGIETGLHYPVPLHLQKAYAHLGYKMGDFPVTEALSSRILSLPMFPTITREQVQYVCAAVMELTECATAKA